MDVAARLGASVSMYYSADALGQYDMILEESVQISDVLVDPNCLPAASERDCIVRQLRLMALAPVLIKAKPSASNLVKVCLQLGWCCTAQCLECRRSHIPTRGASALFDTVVM